MLDACEEWLRQAETLVDEADAKIEAIMRPDGGSLLAEEWVTFVHKYSMQIKDIEQVRFAGSHPHPPAAHMMHLFALFSQCAGC